MFVLFRFRVEPDIILYSILQAQLESLSFDPGSGLCPPQPAPNPTIPSWEAWALGIKDSFMIAEQTYVAHSAQVEMRLILNGESVSITHMGPDYVLVELAASHPPCDATILLRVDKAERRWTVRLPSGIPADSRRVEIAEKAG